MPSGHFLKSNDNPISGERYYNHKKVSSPLFRFLSEKSMKKTTTQQQKPGSLTDKADGESTVLENIAGMPEPDRAMGGRLHALIRAVAPALVPRLWYGMPAYARDGKVICFFQSSAKFNTRYMTLGFSDQANLDEGSMWPTSFALKELTAAEEARIVALVKRAVS
jgi:uncharacterized protein YdhG (YjbR/CyaY superfamily)